MSALRFFVFTFSELMFIKPLAGGLELQPHTTEPAYHQPAQLQMPQQPMQQRSSILQQHFYMQEHPQMHTTFQARLPLEVNTQNATQLVYPQFARQTLIQQTNPTGNFIYSDQQNPGPTQGWHSSTLPSQVPELQSQLVTPLPYSSSHASLDSAPYDSTAPAIVSPQFQRDSACKIIMNSYHKTH